MYNRCISIRSCSQTWPGICSQTRPGISLCFLSGLSLQGRRFFLVLLNQSEKEQESLSALALNCLYQRGLTSWSVSLHFHRTILLFLLLCKIMFPSPVGALIPTHTGTWPWTWMLRSLTRMSRWTGLPSRWPVSVCITSLSLLPVSSPYFPSTPTLSPLLLNVSHMLFPFYNSFSSCLLLFFSLHFSPSPSPRL